MMPKSSMVASGCSWCIPDGTMKSGQWWSSECPFIVVICSSKAALCLAESLCWTLPNLAFEVAGGSQHPRFRFLFNEVITEKTVSHDTTTVLPLRFPRPSSPCHAMGRQLLREWGCSEKTLWSPFVILNASQKLSRWTALSVSDCKPPTSTLGWWVIR